jgi:DNA-binding transcriptional MerR regulator
MIALFFSQKIEQNHFTPVIELFLVYDSMGKYSIKELEKLSGIKAHTIRIWEKRHHIVSPQRTQTNIRYYTDEDLKKIINVSLLNANGIKISRIASLSSEDLVKQVGALSQSHGNVDIHIDQLIIAMIDLEEEIFEKILGNLILRYGFEKTITTIVYPFLEKIGVLWQTGNITPAQEHFITNLIRQKIIVAIDSLPLPPRDSKRILLFLPDQELHELGLLFDHYIAKNAGFRTYYLGQMVPYKDVITVCEAHRPHILITTITNSPAPQAVQGYLNKLCQDKQECSILASGHVLKKIPLKKPSNLHLFFNVNELIGLLKGLH